MEKYFRLDSYYLWILVCCLAIFFFNHDILAVNIMEARNFITAREMVEYDNWLLTTKNLIPRYEKPPLPTWITAVFGWVFGTNNVPFLRIPSAIISTIMAFGMFAFTKQLLVNTKQAFFTTLILISSFYIVFAGRNGTWDIYTHAFMVLAIHQLYRAFTSDKSVWKNWGLAGIFIGLSILSKGPVSLYALLLPFLIAFGIIFKYKGFQKKWIPLIVCIIIAIVVGGWWYYYIRVFDPENTLRIANKETAAWANHNVRPFYYYWSFFTQSGIWTIPAFISLLYPYLKTRVSNLKLYQFSLLWTLIAVVLLSIIPEKKSRYLLPVLIPLALNCSFYIQYLVNHVKELTSKETLVYRIQFGIIALVCVTFPAVGYFFLDNQLANFEFNYWVTSFSLFLIGVGILHELKNKHLELVFYLNIVVIMIVLTVGFPMAKMFYNNPQYTSIATVFEDAKDAPLYSYEHIGELAPEFNWDAKKPISVYKENATFQENELYVIVSDRQDGIAEKFEAYHHKLIKVYDINTLAPKAKGYKQRLTAHLYYLKKKD